MDEMEKEWFEHEVKFTINGRETSDRELIVLIPLRYADLFEGHEFRSKEHFSRALMYAGVANEAFYYNRPWVMEANERALKRLLEIK